MLEAEQPRAGINQSTKIQHLPYPGLKLGVGWHKIQLGVHGGPVLEAGQPLAGINRINQPIN